jgi:uncharacterized 2Fe-2S/4Fe-4S cluster protein (DUF4445 family)
MRERPCHIGVRLDGERDESVRQLAFEPGPSLRDILSRSSVPVRSACAGIGACGLCRVRVDEGDGGPATAAELLHLGPEAVSARTRLACQITPHGDMDVTVLEPARPSPWRAPDAPAYRPAFSPSPGRAPSEAPFGVAVDLGTTNISIGVCDVTTGWVAVRSGPNPQARVGGDVVARLDAAVRSEPAAQELRRLAIEAIGGGLLELSQREGVALPAVSRVRVVGNSAMLALLGADRAGAVLAPAGWVSPVECALGDRAGVAEAWNLSPTVAIDLVQPLGGFVGSDLAAGVVHARLTESLEPALLIDFGTNSELALWDGERLWVTAAAGGPAFEAAGIGCGVRAEPGAIHRLSRSPDGAWSAEVLESGTPRGVCGSGLVDLLALLRAGGEIDERGRPSRAPLTISLPGSGLAVSKADIDTLQRAKAAVAAGVEVLCRRAGLRPLELAAVHVAGSFGEHLDVTSAQQIGLLPPVAAERVRLAGNTALHGALDLLLSGEAEAALARARQRTILLNLSMEPEFEDLFVEHLHIRPMSAPGERP